MAVLQTGGVLLKQAKQKAAAAVVQPSTPAAAIGPDNDGDAVMLKPQLAAQGLSRKRPAEDNQAEAELAHQSDHNHQEATQLDSREPEGIEALTLEQRVNALQLQHATAPGKPTYLFA